MGRAQERIRRKLENNPVMECNKVRDRYCPDLFHDFADTKDPRNQSYTEYSNDELLGTMFYKACFAHSNSFFFPCTVKL